MFFFIFESYLNKGILFTDLFEIPHFYKEYIEAVFAHFVVEKLFFATKTYSIASDP